LKHRFLDLSQLAFWGGQGAENDFKVPWEPLKHRFIEFIQDPFCPVQGSENEFAASGDLLNHRFLDLNKIAFRAVKRQKMNSKCNASHWNIAF